MEADRIDITPQTKVGELLTAYPELEDLLIEIAPAFKKLRKPVLRRTVAKVTSLAQAARVGRWPQRSEVDYIATRYDGLSATQAWGGIGSGRRRWR